MNDLRIKTIIAVFIILSVFTACIVAGHASVICSTYLVWNANETQASAVTEADAPTMMVYHVIARIESHSTGMKSFSYTNAFNGGHASTTAGPVNVTYPSPIPLIDYSGGWAIGQYGESY